MSSSQPSSSGLNIGDILYVLFKHKWKILFVSALSLAAASIYYFRAEALYQSQAKLMIRYVLERNVIDDVENTSQGGTVKRGDVSVVGAQMEILTSWDLADQVAEQITPQVLAPGVAEPNTRAVAAGVVRSGLLVNSPKGSNVIYVSFSHTNPELAKTVLDAVLAQFFTKHLEIYRSAGAAKFVLDRVEKSRTSLKLADETLKDLKTNAGILALPEAIANLSGAIEKARTDLRTSETEMAAQRAYISRIKELLGGEKGASATIPPPSPAGGTEVAKPASAGEEPSLVARNEPAVNSSAERRTASPQIIAEYRSRMETLAQLRNYEMTQMSKFMPGSAMVKPNQSRIRELEQQQREVEAKYPDLVSTVKTEQVLSSPALDLLSADAELAKLEGRVAALQEYLKKLEAEESSLREAAPAIAQAERDREVEENTYKYIGTSLEKVRTDEALDTKNIPNITKLQAPSPPVRDVTMRNKIAMGIAGSGPLLGIGGVLLFGLLLNRSIKRSPELENLLGIPPALTIPWFDSRSLLRLRESAGKTNAGKVADSQAITAPWNPNHFIRTYSETLKDRLSLFFRVNNITHKPKLIGVTGFAAGAGTSTLAAGLAASLSETGDGRVLLVDMNVAQGEPHPFFSGRSAVSLSHAITTGGEMESTADNLYLAKAEPGRPGSVSYGLNRLAGMIPNLKASQFDYVVFDMPPLGQTSPTAAMAGMLDKILVIVEAEVTSKEETKQGYRELVESGADMMLILNKAREYGPKALSGGF